MIANGREIIRAGYAAGRPVAEIAAECGSTPSSVMVIAHKMGIRHQRRPSRVKSRPRPPYAGYDRFEPAWGGPTVTGALRNG